MKLSTPEKKELLVEMRKIYDVCAKTGYEPAAVFVKMGKIIKAELSSNSDEAEELYQSQTREQIEEWLEAVETNIENADSGGTEYRDNEMRFIEDMRSKFEEKADWDKPLTGNQLRWLKALYDKS